MTDAARGFRVEATTRIAHEGLILSETAHSGGARYSEHTHDLPYFDLVIRGSHVERFPGGSFELTSSRVAYRPAGWQHRNAVHTGGVRCFNVEFEERWLQQRSAGYALPGEPIQFAHGQIQNAMARLRRELLAPDRFSLLAIEGGALELVAWSGRRSHIGKRPPAWMAIVEDVLRQPGKEVPTLSQLAAAAGVHPSHLARMVRRHFGASVGEMARVRRVERAAEQLVGSAMPLSKVAVSHGFCDQAHLTRVMRRVLGVTPGQLRRESPRTSRPNRA